MIATRKPDAATNSFLMSVFEIDDLLTELADKRADHFGADPENITWGDVASAERLAYCLRVALGREE